MTQMKKSLYILFIIFCFGTLTEAQNRKMDSIFNTLKTAKPDTDKILNLNKVINYYLSTSDLVKVDSMNEIINNLAGKLNHIRGKTFYFINKARVAETKGDYANALGLNLEALKLAEKAGEKDNMAIAHNHIGIIYFIQGDVNKALENYKRAVEEIKSRGDSKQLAAFLNNIGNIHYNKKEFDLALEYYSRSLKTRENLKDKDGIANSYNNIGSVYLEQNQLDRALDCFTKAEKLQSETGNKFELAYSYLNEGLSYEKKANEKLAETQFLKGHNIANEINSPELKRDASDALTKFYEKRNKHQLALKYYKILAAIKDSINNNEIEKQISEKELHFEYTKKELLLKTEQEKKEIQFRESESRQRIITISTIVGLIIVILFSISLYKRFKLTSRQNEIIEHKNKEIVDSINYAKRIQVAILTPVEIINKSFSGAFVLYKPKDIVSGDFYWFAETNLNKIIAVADCTGHGVPGGFMSMLGYEMLQDVVLKENISTTSEALKALDIRITETLNKSSKTFRDGMDMVLCAFGKNKNKLQYSGANRPLIHISNGKLNEYAPDKNTIGGDIDDVEKKYKHEEIDLQKGDMIYIFTDGYADQFGGPEGKKFKTKQFKQLLLEVYELSPEEQQRILTEKMNLWRGKLEQVDDVCVIGIRI